MDSRETMIGKVFKKEEGKKKRNKERRVHDRRSRLNFNGRVHPFVISQNLVDNLVYGGKAESARWSNLLSVSTPPPSAIYVSARSPYLATVSSLRSTRVKCRFTVTLSVFLLPSSFPRFSSRCKKSRDTGLSVTTWMIHTDVSFWGSIIPRERIFFRAIATALSHPSQTVNNRQL